MKEGYEGQEGVKGELFPNFEEVRNEIRRMAIEKLNLRLSDDVLLEGLLKTHQGDLEEILNHVQKNTIEDIRNKLEKVYTNNNLEYSDKLLEKISEFEHNDVRKIESFLETPWPALQNKTPMDYLTEGGNPENIYNIIRAIEEGYPS